MSSDPKLIKHSGELLLRDEYDGLYKFFQNIWDMPHAYVVMMARRCVNLNEIFMEISADEGSKVSNKERIISNSALLLYSDEIADYYNAWGRFPSIVIADDLIYHGRGIVNLLYELESLVVARLIDVRKSPLTKDERYYVHRDLSAMIDICAFCVNRQPLLIDDVNLRHLRAESKRFTSELRRISQRISIFLQRAGGPNTSYVLSSAEEFDFSRGSENWMKQSWSYRGSRQDMFLCVSDTHHVSPGFLPTVRVHRRYDEPESSNVKLTSLVVFGEMTTDKVGSICQEIAKELQKPEYGFDNFKTLPRILNSEHLPHQKPRVQMLSLLLSMICFRHFYRDMGLAESGPAITNTDMEKVARNFARREEIEDELCEVYTQPYFMDRLESLLYGEISSSAQPFLTQRPPRWTFPNTSTEKANTAVERLFYDIGMRSEKSAWRTVESLKRFSPKLPSLDLISLQQYMADVSSEDKNTAAISEASAVSCMLAEMDNGLMSMNVETNLTTAEDSPSACVRCVLKAGELATFVMPRYFHQFIPALALVERKCWMLKAEPLEAVIQFIQELPDKMPRTSEYADNLAKALEAEEEVFQTLKQEGAVFVARLYECGQSLNGWDFDLATMDDWHCEGSYLSFVCYERERQQIYLDLAESFLAKYKK